MKATLALADGRIFQGESFGAAGEVTAEIIFNTSMSGYQEILTDPSYCGQMIVMTYPLIGNYGINSEDFESDRPYLSAFIIKELSGIPSNWRSRSSLDQFLKETGVMGIQGIDTRALTRHIREAGAQQAVISTETDDNQLLVEKARKAPSLVGRDMVKEVTCRQAYDWNEGERDLNGVIKTVSNAENDGPFFVVAYDFGIKRNILRKLVGVGCKVKVVPASTPAEQVLEMKPDGVFLSNGPGDPAGVPYVVDNVKKLFGKVPVFGICLGHQIITRALGADTYKLRFGHHGGNQPVMDLRTRRVEITSQNHGFAVANDSIADQMVVSSINLNDRTIEGIRHPSLPIFSVQYHPEASPGPNDSQYLFHKFLVMMKENR